MQYFARLGEHFGEYFKVPLAENRCTEVANAFTVDSVKLIYIGSHVTRKILFYGFPDHRSLFTRNRQHITLHGISQFLGKFHVQVFRRPVRVERLLIT